MTHTEFYDQLKAGKLKNVYFFFGEEAYVKADALSRLRKAILEPGSEAMNETVFEGGTAQDIIEAADQLPLFSDRRLTVAYDFPPLLPRKARDEENETSRIIEWLPDAPDTGVVVFFLRGEGDGRKKLYKRLSEVCGVEFALLSEPEAARWAVRRARELGCAMDGDTAEKLVFMAGRQLIVLDGELQKLCAYTQDRGRVLPDDLERAVTPSGECTVFQMIDAAAAGRPLEARRLTRRLVDRGESRLGVAAMVTRQIRILTHAAGLTQDALQKALDMSPYAARRAKRQAERLNPGKLRAAYEAAVDIDFQVKNGRLREEIALDETLSLLDTLVKK